MKCRQETVFEFLLIQKVINLHSLFLKLILMSAMEMLVRSQVKQQMSGVLAEVRLIKQQSEAQSRINKRNDDQIAHLRRELQLIKKQNYQLRETVNLNLQKQNQSINYSLMSNQREIEQINDIIRNMQGNGVSQNYVPITQNNHFSVPNTPNIPHFQKHFQKPEQLPQKKRVTQIFGQPKVARKSQKIFVYHLGNAHNDRFIIKAEFNKIKVQYNKEWDGHCYNFIKSGQLGVGRSTVFKMKQVRTASRYIMTGIGTNEMFGVKDAHRMCESITYFSANGNIWSDGKCVPGGRAINDGEVVAVNVDTGNWIISWSVGVQPLAIAEIPVGMRGKAVYFVVMLVHKNDEVQVMLD